MKALSLLALVLLHQGPAIAQLLDFNGACSIPALSDDTFSDIAVDQDGNVYVIGTVGSQILVGKRTPDCQWLWMEQWGTNGNDRGLSIELDHLGHLYLSGTLSSGTVTYQGVQVRRASGYLIDVGLDRGHNGCRGCR